MAGPHNQPLSRPAVKLTYDDFVHFSDDGRRHELIEDVVRVYRRSDEGFERPMELRRDVGDKLTTPLLPQLELLLEEIFSS